MNSMLHKLHNALTPVGARRFKVFGSCAALSAGLLLMTVTGCRSPKNHVHGEDFSNHEVQSATNRLAEVQAAAGARADGMLHAKDFDGGVINSLGRSKLDLMIKDDQAITPLVVYLDLPEGNALNKARHDSTVLFLKDRGLLDSQIRIENGINPDSLNAAEPNLLRLPKTESSGEPGGDKPTAAAAQ